MSDLSLITFDPTEVTAFDTVPVLAARIEALRARRGLEVIPAVICFPPVCDEAPGFNLYVTPKGGDRQFLAAVVAPHIPLTRLMAELAAARANNRRRNAA